MLNSFLGWSILNPWPDLLAFSPVADFILRLALGLTLISLGYQSIKLPSENRNLFVAWLEIIIGIFITIGLFTQIASSVSLIWAVVSLVAGAGRGYQKFQIPFYILTIAISLALLFLGAGILAIDLPL